MLILSYEVTEDEGIWLENRFYRYGAILQIPEDAAKYYLLAGSLRPYSSDNTPLPILIGPPDRDVVYLQITKNGKTAHVPLASFIERLATSLDLAVTGPQATSLAALLVLGYI